ncbi:XdhC family protein [Candidatus Riflebacteria bacterium]
MDREIIHHIKEMRESDNLCLVTLVETRGSTPKPAGCSMLVNMDGRLAGSVGGGCVEGRVIELARQVIKTGRNCFFEEILNDELSGHMCGGKAIFYLEKLIN